MNLYIASGSKHPMENFGCTSCHGGLDRATDFQSAGHTPRNEKQKEEWIKKFGWHTDEFLTTPMLAMDKVESGCYKCHNSSPDVSQAAALDNGRDLIRIYGCFGCHKIPGYDGVRKVGPDLSTVSGKLTKDWIRKWLADPKAFKSEARMPRFWNNSNNSGTIGGVDWDKRSAAEINAITEYVWSKSKPKVLPAVNPSGNAAHGKELVESVGCYGCHSVGPIDQSGTQSQTRRRHGFNLASQGSKVSASWIYNWVKDPKLVWAETKMPNLRLTDGEAADVTAYLSSLKNDAWTAKPLPAVDTAALDDVVREFLLANSTRAEAEAKLKTMSLEEKNLMAGERLVRRYGCFACHNIPGMENEQPIGTELTEAGSKLVSQLDFGFMPIEHDRASWYTQKLTDPRSFDVGRVKTPEELLKMPNFTFNPQDVQAITMVLTSMVKDKVPQEMREKLSKEIIAGRQLIDEKNCKGCHIIEQMGGDIRGFLKGATNQVQWPPNLNTEGLKTQPMWLAKFINDPGAMKLRLFLNTRMPTFHFTQNEISTLTAYFSAVDKAPFPFISTAIDTTSEKLSVGSQLFETLKCMQCHPTSSAIPPGKDPADLAPNLQLAQGRLRPEWVLDWVKDPQKIFPGTRMPAFFPDYPKSPITNVLGGDAKAQIEAIRDHLFVTVGGGARTTAAAGN
jgi:cytochrome c2